MTSEVKTPQEAVSEQLTSTWRATCKCCGYIGHIQAETSVGAAETMINSGWGLNDKDEMLCPVCIKFEK